jgi:alkylation response protein AidB-like acyl-CoA dehydrogenase
VDFTFSPEQEALREAARSYLARPESSAALRQMIEDERGFTEQWWSALGNMGWTGVLLPGLGTGLLDAVVLQEEMGRVAMPGPFFSSAVAAARASVLLGDEELQQRLAAGQRGTVAIEEAGYGDPLETITTRATPVANGRQGEWRLDGLKPVVVDGHTADFAIIAARTPEGGLGAFVVEEPAGQPVPSLDVTRKAARLELSGRPARRVGGAGDQAEVLARIGDDLAVALCAETVGASERALQMAVEYAKQRVQFDRPIATFQAIKHKIVDMLHQLELARVGTHWAAWCSDVDDPLREQAAAACKGFVSEAAVMVTAENIQVHGGVGFTWDLDCHLLFRRVKQNDVLFGSQTWNRRRLADLVLGPAKSA